jgi:hypothetical protein
MQPLFEHRPKQHSALFSACGSFQALLFSEGPDFNRAYKVQIVSEDNAPCLSLVLKADSLTCKIPVGNVRI